MKIIFFIQLSILFDEIDKFESYYDTGDSFLDKETIINRLLEIDGI